MAVFRIEKNRSYTVMSNYHLRDRSLSLKAKGLLSLMLSLPEEWDYTEAGLSAICGDGLDSVRSGIKELERRGYLRRNRVRDEKGRMGGTEYLVREKPEEAPRPEKPALENPILDKPGRDNPEQGKPGKGKPELGKATQSNTKESITQELIKESINQSSEGERGKEEERRDYTEEIRKQVGYGAILLGNRRAEELLEAGKIDYRECDAMTVDVRIVDFVISVMNDCYGKKEGAAVIGGEKVEWRKVEEAMRRIGKGKMGEVVRKIQNCTTPITNKRAYTVALLYNEWPA